MRRFNHTGHADSFLPEGKSWKLVWHDEFDGTELDTSKWSFRLNFWGKPFKAFTDEGAVLDGNSSLQLHLVKKGDSYCSPHLQTGSLTYDMPKDSNGFWPFGKIEEPKFLHKFGYYEIRCRMPKNDGWHSAFWLQAPGIGSHPRPEQGGVECDIMENYRMYKEGKLIAGNIWNGYGKNVKAHGHFRWDFVETDDKWHYFGVDWSPAGYVFYADGKEVGRVVPDPKDARPGPDGKSGILAGPVSNIEQFILVSTECHGYREKGVHSPLLDNAILPDYFEVDHVRVFDEVNASGETQRTEPEAHAIPESDQKAVFMF